MSGTIGMLRGKPFIIVAAVFLAAMLAARLGLTAAFEGELSFAQALAGAKFSALRRFLLVQIAEACVAGKAPFYAG